MSAHNLKPLAARTAVMIQTKGKWNKSGHIVDVLPHRQYRVKVDGSGRVTLRNRRFLRCISGPTKTTTPPVSAARPAPVTAAGGTTPGTVTSTDAVSPSTAAMMPPNTMPPTDAMTPATTTADGRQDNPDTLLDYQQPPQATFADETSTARRVPKALRGLLDYNKPGLADQEWSQPGRTRSGRL